MRGGGGIQNFRFSRCKTFERDENLPCEGRSRFFEKCTDRQISCELDNRKRREMEGRIKAVQATLQCFYSVSQLSIKFVCACAHHVMINLGLLRILSILLSLVSDSNASGGGGARGFFAHQLSKLHTNQYILQSALCT